MRGLVRDGSFFLRETMHRYLGKPETSDEGHEAFERLLLTEFLSGSNFFDVGNPEASVISYASSGSACGNPFARLEPT